MLSSLISFNSETDGLGCFLKTGHTYVPNEPIGGIIIKEHSYFTNNCGNLVITGCEFRECNSSTKYGGAISIVQDCSVTIHNTIFHSCSTNSNAGGACFIVKETNTMNCPNFDNGKVPEMDIQY